MNLKEALRDTIKRYRLVTGDHQASENSFWTQEQEDREEDLLQDMDTDIGIRETIIDNVYSVFWMINHN